MTSVFSIYLPEVRHLYIHKEISLAPVPLGAQPPRRRRVLSYLCVAEIYDPTNSNRNAAYLQHPAHSNMRKSKAVLDVFGPEYEDAGFRNLDITYAVRPGSAWSILIQYRNFIGK